MTKPKLKYDTYIELIEAMFDDQFNTDVKLELLFSLQEDVDGYINVEDEYVEILYCGSWFRFFIRDGKLTVNFVVEYIGQGRAIYNTVYTCRYGEGIKALYWIRSKFGRNNIL